MNLMKYAILVSLMYMTAGPSHGQALTAVKPLEGVKCMSLNLTEEELRSEASLPPVFAGPAESSRKLGTNGATVVVVWPLNNVNGFTQILRLGGEHAWISEKVLSPYHRPDGSPGTCVPSLMSNGRIGFNFSDSTRSSQ